jgi:hypothetical protein
MIQRITPKQKEKRKNKKWPRLAVGNDIFYVGLPII